MRFTLFCLFLTLFVVTSGAQTTDIYSTSKGAIKGYDPVAYFTAGKPVRGLDTLTFVWKDAVWHFSSIDNRNMFEQEPEKYAPQYGGYCAYGWAQGYAVKTEPDAWAIVDGRLYLNYDRSIQKKWDKNQRGFIELADKNWAAARKKH